MRLFLSLFLVTALIVGCGGDDEKVEPQPQPQPQPRTQPQNQPTNTGGNWGNGTLNSQNVTDIVVSQCMSYQGSYQYANYCRCVANAVAPRIQVTSSTYIENEINYHLGQAEINGTAYQCRRQNGFGDTYAYGGGSGGYGGGGGGQWGDTYGYGYGGSGGWGFGWGT